MMAIPGFRICVLVFALSLVMNAGCDNDRRQVAREEPRKSAESDKATELKKVEAELLKVKEATKRANEVAAQLRLLMPLYERCAIFQRDTLPDIAVVLSGPTAGLQLDIGKAQPAIFHMVNIVNANSLAYRSARDRILEHAGQTNQVESPVVHQLLGLYGKSIEHSLDCTELMQRLQRGEWSCRQDQDFQKYVDRYSLNVSDAGGNSCFGVRDAIRTACGAAYSTTAKANTLYASE